MIPQVVGVAGYVVTEVPDDLLLEVIHGDFMIEVVDAWCQIQPGEFVEIPGSRAVIAGDRPLGTVGKRWHPVQNFELLSMARSFAAALDSNIEVGGVTPDLRRTWFWIPIEDGFSSIVSTAHDGRGSVSIQLVVDDGDSIARIGPREEWLTSFPHGPTLVERFENPTELASWADRWLQATKTTVEHMKNQDGTSEMFLRLAEPVLPIRGKATLRKENTRRETLDKIASRWVSRADQRGRPKNVFDLVMSFSWYLDLARDGQPRYLADQALEDSNWVARLKTEIWSLT